MIYRFHEVSEQFGKRRFGFANDQALERVRHIVHQVAAEGDVALDRWSLKLDGRVPYEVPRHEWREAYEGLSAELRQALDLSAKRVETFYKREPVGGFISADQDGLLGQLVRPLTRVGVYVPGGTAPLSSSVIMGVIPARVAGVGEIVLATPPVPHPLTLAAAWVAGADRLLAMGGAQAVAALAYGTSKVPRVDKVVGPGNMYVTLAKREVYGVVGLDGLAGPTETLIIADDSASPALLAADLLAQAEHDFLAEPWLVADSLSLLESVERELELTLHDLPREEIARAALANGGLVLVSSLEEALELANLYAPEHLCLSVREPIAWLGKVQNAGGVFLGEYSNEALGDYIAGPSHVMPTAGTARFSGALAVRDFLKVIPLIGLAREPAAELAGFGALLAHEEQLEAHVRALLARRGKP